MSDTGTLRRADQGAIHVVSVTSGTLRPVQVPPPAPAAVSQASQGAAAPIGVAADELRPARADMAVINYNEDPYTGEYVFTPTQEIQRVRTKQKTMTEDIIINPIPQNYGLITWNGSVLTVS